MLNLSTSEEIQWRSYVGVLSDFNDLMYSSEYNNGMIECAKRKLSIMRESLGGFDAREGYMVTPDWTCDFWGKRGYYASILDALGAGKSSPDYSFILNSLKCGEIFPIQNARRDPLVFLASEVLPDLTGGLYTVGTYIDVEKDTGLDIPF